MSKKVFFVSLVQKKISFERIQLIVRVFYQKEHVFVVEGDGEGQRMSSRQKRVRTAIERQIWVRSAKEMIGNYF